MSVIIPPPLAYPPESPSFWQAFRLLFLIQLRISLNKIRHWPIGAWIAVVFFGLGMGSIFVYMGIVAYRAMSLMPLDTAAGFLSLIFLMSISGQVFFGITAAFVTLYMSEDLELLFVSPVPLRAVFAVKAALVAGSNFLTALLFAYVPGILFGVVFNRGVLFFAIVLLVGTALWILGTAIAILLNMVVMRIIPPHRSKEAVGFIGGIAGVLIALFFQIPNLLLSGESSMNMGDWLAGQGQFLRLMSYFPWGWGANAVAGAARPNLAAGFGWAGLLMIVGCIVFLLSFTLVERGFRRGWVSVSQGAAARRRKKSRRTPVTYSNKLPLTQTAQPASAASMWPGMWAVAKKDLLYMKRDMREWFGYVIPLIIMVFFVAQYLFLRHDAQQISLIMVLLMYTLMFSGNIALQSFGREGEADWFLNSVPLFGWPVVWGKLIAAVLPTLILMEALLAGTAIAIGVSFSLTLMLAVGAFFLTFGSSAIGLFYSINNARFNPDSPHQRIAPGASLFMYLINTVFILVLALGFMYLIPPAELVAALPQLSEIPLKSGFFRFLLQAFILISRPLLWAPALRITAGMLIAGSMWALFFFGFMAATVRQSRKGFRVELVAVSSKRKKAKKVR